jgi:hypothetical protein
MSAAEVAMRNATSQRGANAPLQKKKQLMRQSAVAPRAEPSRRGAKQWTAGRRDRRKYR